MAREQDPNGERTLGVLTKPDLVDRGAEKKIMDMVEGKELRMNLGWSIVRNLGQKELSDGVNRDLAEDHFFRQTAPWNSLDKDKVGVEALKVRLREVLIANIRREFPKVSTLGTYVLSHIRPELLLTEYYIKGKDGDQQEAEQQEGCPSQAGSRARNKG